MAGNDTRTLSLNDYLTGYYGVPLSERVPFFIQLVDGDGNVKPLPVKQQGSNPSMTGLLFSIKLNVNPSTASLNIAKLINRTQTMTAWVEDHWGEELDTITFQGSTAAFVIGGQSLAGIRNGGIATQVLDQSSQIRRAFNEKLGLVDLTTALPADDVGLTTYYRSVSASYQQMKHILMAMRTNGVSYDSDDYGDHLGLVSSRNYIRVAYDYACYDGYIESFDLTEIAESPFKFNYTITFKSEKTVFNYIK